MLWLCVCAVACGERTVDRLCDGRLTTKIVEPVPRARVNALDLLFVVDDSAAMVDKQRFLVEAIPELVDALFAEAPLVDMHVGILTSSLGGQGSDSCVGQDENDHAQLLTHDGAEVLPTYQDLGFLFWDPNGEAGGDSDAATFADKLSTMVLAAGDRGCGFEAPLEAWYRFLVEPAPHDAVVIEKNQAVLEGVDEVLLAQRRAFLRPDSLLAIVMLTDENDCSIRHGGQYFYALQQTQIGGVEPYHLPKPRAACAVDPNDPCCRSCGQSPGEGCSTALDDCDESLSDAEDPHHLRCFDQKRRFGIDFTWPVERYVEGLTQLQVTDDNGNVVDNPLFTDLAPDDARSAVRDPSLVFLSGIVGVPWHDLARPGDDGLPDANAGLQTSEEMDQMGTWDLIVGEPSCYHTDPSCLPTDPLMRESVDPRSGVHPLTGDALVPPGSPPPSNPINGHERELFDELQFACLMPLPEPRDCAGSSSSGCPCTNPDNADPRCRDASGAYGQTQYFAGAQPGIRELQVLEGMGDQGIVGSACAAPEPNGYGYASSLAKLVERVAHELGANCLPRILSADDQGRAPCTIVEASAHADCDAACAEPGRAPFDDQAFVAKILDQPAAAVANWSCFCEVEQLAGAELEVCQQDASNEEELGADGWCYVDAGVEPPVGNPEIVAHCPESDKRQLRFVGGAADVGPLFISCGEGAADNECTR